MCDREMTLVEDLKNWRADRPDEWTMDRFIRKAEELEKPTISTYAELGKVFAEIEEYYSHRDNDMMRISRQQFEIIKSKYLP